MKALYDYAAEDESELPLTEGEIITNISLISEGKGQNCEGTTEWFPLNYCQVTNTIARLFILYVYAWINQSINQSI